ncbi:MAG: hypothetical protein WC728_09060 [Elusimicrobiota bacterium]
MVLVLVALLQLFCVPGHYLGEEHDDAQYVLAARGLLNGRYSLGILPADPPLTFVTPGWPLLLAPAAALSGDSNLGYELWSWAWLVLCDVLVWLWLRRRAGPWPAMAGAAAFGLNPLVLSRSGVVMSEVPFLATALGLLLALDRPLKGAWSGLALGFAWLIRPGAGPLFPATWAAHAVKRRWRDLGVSVVLSLGCVLAWKAWVASAGDRLAEFKELALASPTWGGGSDNLREAALLLGQTLLPWPAPDGLAPLLAGALFAAVSLAGMVVAFRRERRLEPVSVYVLCWIGMHAFWPYWYERYLVTLLPFLLWGFCEALRAVVRPESLRAGLLAALALVPFPGQARWLLSGTRERSVPELQETYSWIRERTDPAAMFSSAFFCRDALYTGRPTVPLPLAGDDGPLARRLSARRVRYVLWQNGLDLGSTLGESFHWTRALNGAARELAGPGFRPVYGNAREGSVVYEVL